MENKKVFIGNLDFEVTENDVKTLLSKYGTVINVKMNQKKGYAFVEMSDPSEVAKAVQKLEGVKYRDREIRISLEMKSSKAKAFSVKRYKERGAGFAREKSKENSDAVPRSEGYRDTSKNKYGKKSSGSSYGKSKRSYKPEGRSEKPDENHEGEKSRLKHGLPAAKRDRWSTEKPSDYPERNKRERAPEKHAYRDRPSRDGEKRGLDYSKEQSGIPGSKKREWNPEKSANPSKKTGDTWKEKPAKREFTSDKPRDFSKPRSVNGTQNRSGKMSGTKPGGKGRTGSSSSRPKPGGGAVRRIRKNRLTKD